MRKQSSNSRHASIWAVSLFTICAAVFLAGRTVYGSLHSNLFGVNELESLLSVSSEKTNDLYWNVEYDWQRNVDTLIIVEPSASDGVIMLSVLKAALLGDGRQVILMGQGHTDACLRRLSCRMLYARAAFALGREDLIWFQSLDENLWYALAGKGAPQVRTQEELAYYQEFYEALLPLYPKKPELYHILGSINRTMGGWSKALPYFEKALTLAPDNARYRCTVGEALVYSGQAASQGLELCLEALQDTPNDMWLYEKAGRSHAKQGRCDEALELYEEAKRLFPSRTEPGKWINNFLAGQMGECPVSDL